MLLQTTIPEHITSRELTHVVRLLGIRLVAKPDGSILGIPIIPERHGNQGLRRIPRRSHREAKSSRDRHETP